ncbi:MAG: general secretion pathway protein GspB [Desulfobulbaceae bacterium]|nr:general secretion pathway protein GspB [Desulfobulbaceae bacterium]
MTLDRTISTILTVSFLVIAIPAVLFFRKLPNSDLTPAEKELISFSSKPVALSSPQTQVIFSGLPSPLRGVSKSSGAIPAKNAKSVSVSNATTLNAKKNLQLSLGSLPVVSMIYFAGSTRMAIVDNHVVHEGSTLNSGVIIKIEKTRVLMRKTGKDIWLTTE